MGVGPRQGLQRLVGLRETLAAQDGLDALGHHGPVVLQVARQRLGVEDHLVQPLEQRLQGDHRVGHRHADVAQHGRVGQIALEARDGQLRGEVLENSVGDAEVALGVLEVDGVDLVGHGARSDLPGLDLLFEVFHRNVGPHVAREVDEDGVDALHVVEDGRQVVVVLDLRGVLRAAQPQRLVHEPVGESHPVDFGVGRAVGVEVARGAAELGRNGDVVEHEQLLFEPLDEYRKLFAQRGRRGGLPVRARQHRNLAPLLGERRQSVADLLDDGVVDARHRLPERERNGRVVDVLRREAEMHELLIGLQPEGVHFLLDDVLDGLYVVVGHRLDLLHAPGVGVREIEVERAQGGEFRAVDAGQLRQRQFAQGDEVFHFDADAVADEGLLRKIIG